MEEVHGPDASLHVHLARALQTAQHAWHVKSLFHQSKAEVFVNVAFTWGINTWVWVKIRYPKIMDG